jgi:hypothetical protein
VSGYVLTSFDRTSDQSGHGQEHALQQFRCRRGELEFELGRDEVSPLVRVLGSMRALIAPAVAGIQAANRAKTAALLKSSPSAVVPGQPK